MEPFKNIYNENEIKKLAKLISKTYPDFKEEEFIDSLINDTWAQKELKERQRAIALALGDFLPNNYSEALTILKDVHDEFKGLFHLIFPDFIEVYGLEYYEESVEALKLFTQNCSSEFAVRAFLIKYPNFIDHFKLWAKDKNEHIRRLSSEGCRPRLPWGMALSKFKKDPKKVIEVLELLKDDESEYVRKSVANNLNDISKDNPKIAKEVFKKWHGNSKNRNWIVKHGARTLLKEGDIEILSLFGFSSKDIQVSNLDVQNSVKLNDYLNFTFKIFSKKALGKLRIEYKIGLLRQNGKINYKVFKISEKETKEKELLIEKRHSFKEVTTRKYYDGIQTLTIIINGKEFDTKEFTLIF